MTRNAVVLHGAKEDFREIRTYVKFHFGEVVWAEVNQEFKDATKLIAANPLLGTTMEELEGLGFNNFRKTLVRQTRVVYEYDDRQVIVHMFLHTKRDFTTHLAKRLLG